MNEDDTTPLAFELETRGLILRQITQAELRRRGVADTDSTNTPEWELETSVRTIKICPSQ